MSELPKGSDDASHASHVASEPVPFITASHTALFDEAAIPRCDVCDAVLADDDDLTPTHAHARTGDVRDDAHMPSGRGLLVWTRGDERRYQEPPLCPGCAAAIGMSALQRWEIEEEEG